MTEHLLSIDNLNVRYETDLEVVQAVNDISFKLKRQETIGIVGETGAGKTTLALAILNLLPERTGKIRGGSIHFDGMNVLELPEHEMRDIRGNRIAMIFQDPMTSLNPVVNVGQQIGEAVALHNPSWSKEQINERVDEVLSLVGIIPERKNEYPHQFSGGMKQRVVIAIALACEPELLIADEPTTALDVTIQAQVLKMIAELKDRLGTAMIMITHDLGVVAQTCDQVAVVYAGEVVEICDVEDMFNGTAHHPYTDGLFGSIPKLDEETKRLSPIPGLMPDPTDLPQGCNFAPRCEFREEAYLQATPKLVPISETHQIRCVRFLDASIQKEEVSHDEDI